MFPRWYEIDSDTTGYMEHRKEVDSRIREAKVVRTKIEQKKAEERKAAAYDMETVMKAIGNQGNKLERAMDGEIRHTATMLQLDKRVRESERKKEALELKRYMREQQRAKEEAKRLNRILDANKEANKDKWDIAHNSAAQFERLRESLNKVVAEDS
mmetsp:Transcript_20513/g.29443  ORF Transcript_20513/g.29443 Transcript_20513/m.29443 type:complete len:156 (+) Transcript_20513:26-493(+)